MHHVALLRTHDSSTLLISTWASTLSARSRRGSFPGQLRKGGLSRGSLEGSLMPRPPRLAAASRSAPPPPPRSAAPAPPRTAACCRGRRRGRRAPCSACVDRGRGLPLSHLDSRAQASTSLR